MEVPQEQRHCNEHGERKLIGYDRPESHVIVPAKLHVEVKLFPKFICENNPQCGIVSPERPTSSVEGDKYRPSVAAFIVTGNWFHYLSVDRLQDIFAASGWTPSRSTLVHPDVWKLEHPEAERQYRVEEREEKAERQRASAAARRLTS